MFEAFKAAYVADRSGIRASVATTGDARLDELFAEHGGTSFNRGIYRVIAAADAKQWDHRVSLAFPVFAGRVTCFGVDWLGRAFALDRGRKVNGEAGVVLLEPGTGESLEIPCDIVSFHDTELVQYREEALAESFYSQWLQRGGAVPHIDQCVGYKRPLFLGGSDTVDNLEISDLDVYWEVAAQLIAKTRGLPPGTPVNINIK